MVRSDCDFLLPHSSSFMLAPTSTSENVLMASFMASLTGHPQVLVTLRSRASQKLMVILFPHLPP